MKKVFGLLVLSLLIGQGQTLSHIMQVIPRVFVLQNATIHTQPGEIKANASILLRNGLIEAVGSKITIPEDATVIDMNGKHIYAGFIEGWYEVASKGIEATSRSHWIDLIHPEWVASDHYKADVKSVEQLRSLGFTCIHAVMDNGIFRGQSSLIGLDEQATVIKPSVSQVMQFQTRGWESVEYPGALLGTIAVIRQTLYDASWYGSAQEIYWKNPDKNEPVEENLALAALVETKHNPFLFNTGQELAATRAIDIANEFGLDLWLKGSGFEYRRLDDIQKANPFIILPVTYPGKPDVAQSYRAAQYTTDQLKHWDLAPDNAQRLTKSGIPIAFTTIGLKDRKQFRKNLVSSVKRGLDEDAALAALTTTPAATFGCGDYLGKIKPGFAANFIVVDGSYFDPDNVVRSVWINGYEYDVEPEPEVVFNGNWDFWLNDLRGKLEWKGMTSNPSGNVIIDSTTVECKSLVIDDTRISFFIKGETNDFPGVTRFAGTYVNGEWSGTATFANGDVYTWQATNNTPVEKENKIEKIESPSDLSIVYPEGAYGLEQIPDQPYSVFINDATLWTSGPMGVLEDWDMLIVDGKIDKIARDIKIPRNSAVIIDGKDKHVTPGLIDAHSHTAAASINEGSQSVTAEVRIQDVLNPDDISIYRQIAGGTTTINVLHGSANAIGGQNAVIKLRWGANANNLIFDKAKSGIKFALGENVKQSNWGDDYTTRYPQTRMGVEQVIRDALVRAQDYEKAWRAYNKNSRWQKTHVPPRKDLELDALVEVLNGDRMVHCHSYRQDEILMLTRVAEEFGFTVGIFQHVLEGYKIAERIAEHGASASTFTDWWAYKFEVYDAIPYNGTLMHDAGVLVSFNSDDDELARRLNLEAAKGVKYGGLSETDALNTVTINPAKQLAIDQWVGSLEVGKDGDFVIWSGPPLSTSSKCEQTWIDGRRYFSLEENARLKERDQLIRQQLIQKILRSDDDGNPSMSPPPLKDEDEDHCLAQDDILWEEGL